MSGLSALRQAVANNSAHDILRDIENRFSTAKVTNTCFLLETQKASQEFTGSQVPPNH